MRRSVIFAASAVLVLCLMTSGTATADMPKEAQSEPAKEISYSFESPIGIAHMSIRPVTASMVFWIDSAYDPVIPVSAQAKLVSSLLERFSSAHRLPVRLFVTFRDTTDLFKRIGKAATKTAQWNAMTGRPRNGTTNGFIVDEINSKDLAHELTDSFASLGYKLRAKSAEEIIVGPVGDGSAYLVPKSGVVGFIATRNEPKW